MEHQKKIVMVKENTLQCKSSERNLHSKFKKIYHLAVYNKIYKIPSTANIWTMQFVPNKAIFAIFQT